MTDRKFWLAVRQALLMVLDAIERMVEIEPRTAEMRKLLRSYRLTYPFPPIAAEDVKERIEVLRAHQRTKQARPEALPTESSIQPPVLPITIPPPSLPKT